MRALGQKKKALKMLCRNHRACLKFLGETNPLTLLSMNALGYSYQEAGRYVQAKRTYERVLERRLQTLGADDSGTIVTQINLAHVLLHTGDEERALDLFGTAYRRLRQTRGGDHSKTRTTLSSLMTFTYIYGSEEQTLNLAREVQGLYDEDDDLWQEADWLLAECVMPATS
jgi:tetratricopeptide (TPR) repeat protein